MSGRRIQLSLAVLAALLVTTGQAAAQEPDPFYTAMLRDGSQELVRGDAERALEDLRIACFGLLEQTPLLGECLVRVALAQAALGEREEFVETFRRVEELEERFQAYGAAALGATERAEFEKRAIEWVPPQTLAAIPRFAELVERQRMAELAALPEAKRVRELERLAAEDPSEPRWRLQLAEIDLERKRPADALGRLKGLPPAAGDGAVPCLSGRALAGLDRCAEAVAALAACPRRGQEAALLEAELGCLVDLDRKDDARALLVTAPPELATRPAVAKFAAQLAPKSEAKPAKAETVEAERAPVRPTPTPEPRVKRPKKGDPPAAPAAQATASPTPAALPAAQPTPRPRPVQPPVPAATPTPVPTPAPTPAPPPTSTLDAESAATVQEARAAMRSAQRQADLERALALARPVAAAHPEQAELQYLVGEIAYRASRWTDCAAAYLRGGASGPRDATQRFYMAVCLYESGDRASAAAIAASGLERLPRSPFVDGYLKRFGGTAP